MIDAFGGSDTARGNTGPFWVASGLAIFSAIITFVLIRPLSHDGMRTEDDDFRAYLTEHGYDTSLMGIAETTSQSSFDSAEKHDDDIDDIVKEVDV